MPKVKICCVGRRFIAISSSDHCKNGRNLLNPSERHHPQPPNFENALDGETENQRKSRMDRNVQEQRRYGEEESASIKTETKNINGMRQEEADKKTTISLIPGLRK